MARGGTLDGHVVETLDGLLMGGGGNLARGAHPTSFGRTCASAVRLSGWALRGHAQSGTCHMRVAIHSPKGRSSHRPFRRRVHPQFCNRGSGQASYGGPMCAAKHFFTNTYNSRRDSSPCQGGKTLSREKEGAHFQHECACPSVPCQGQ